MYNIEMNHREKKRGGEVSLYNNNNNLYSHK